MLRNRERELSYLDTRYASRRADLVLLYSRRQVSKTTLTYHWVQDKPHISSLLRSKWSVPATHRSLLITISEDQRQVDTIADENGDAVLPHKAVAIGNL